MFSFCSEAISKFSFQQSMSMETAKAKGCKHIARKLHEKSSSVGETSLGTSPFKPYDGE